MELESVAVGVHEGVGLSVFACRERERQSDVEELVSCLLESYDSMIGLVTFESGKEDAVASFDEGSGSTRCKDDRRIGDCDLAVRDDVGILNEFGYVECDLGCQCFGIYRLQGD